MKSGLGIPNVVYVVKFVCLADGVNLKVVATSIAEIDRPVYHDVRNSMPHPIYHRCIVLRVLIVLIIIILLRVINFWVEILHQINAHSHY